jgi:hypothetical protein
MGSPEKFYPHSKLRGLSSAQKKSLHAKIKRLVKTHGTARQIISAHRAMTKELKKKLPKL